jgi:hypothetical protein
MSEAGPSSRSWRPGRTSSRPFAVSDVAVAVPGFAITGPGGRRRRCQMTPGAVDRGAVEVLGAVGSVDGDDPVWVEGELPSSFVDEVVVSAAERRLSHELLAAEAA